VHRDLKPANVLLTEGSQQQARGSGSLPAASCLLPATPKITDFGLAKRLDLDGNSTTKRIAGSRSRCRDRARVVRTLRRGRARQG
jgi:serine/threonine protein kinase